MQRFTKHWTSWLLLIVVVLGGWLRLTQFGIIPPGLTTDEAAITYDAWGISNDGTDQWNHHWPLIFTSLGDGKLPFVHYLLAAQFRVFGFSLYGIRILAALFGVMLIIATYFLSLALFKQHTTALIAAALVSLSPWTIHFSRFGLEAGIAVTLFIIGLLLFFHRSWWSVFFIVAPIYTYHSSLIVVPILFFTALFLFPRFSRKKSILIACLFLLLILPLLISQTRVGWTRASQTIFLPKSLSDVGNRIYKQFSPSFWLWGEQDNYRQSIPGFFPLLLPELTFLLAGIWHVRQLKKEVQVFIAIWFCTALIPSLIGTPSPHTIRSFYVAPLIYVVEANGIIWLFSHWQRSLVILITAYGVCWSMFWRTYMGEYERLSAQDYGYGYAQVMKILQKNSTTDTRYVISPFLDQPYLYTLLYWNITPAEFRAGGLANVSYRSIKWPETQANTLFAGSAQEISPTDPRVITVIPYPNTQNPLWVIAR